MQALFICFQCLFSYLIHSIYLTLHYQQGGMVGRENGVQALCLLSWVAGVVITHLPLLMFWIGEAAPSPEVATGKVTAGCRIVANKTEHIFIIAITTLGSRGWREGESITRITELLHHQWFLDASAYLQVIVNIFLGILASHA